MALLKGLRNFPHNNMENHCYRTHFPVRKTVLSNVLTPKNKNR